MLPPRSAAIVVLLAVASACAEQKPAAPHEANPALGVGLQTEGAEADALGAVRGPVDPPPVGTYPAPPARVEGWIARQQVDSIRAHGWDVWASITSPSGQGRLPVWETWYSGHEVYEMQPALGANAVRRAARDFERPQQFHHVARMGHLRAGHIPIDRAEAITSFNRYTRSLAEYVWNHRYNDAAVLNAIKDIDSRSAGRVDVKRYSTQRPKFAPYAFMATAFWSIALVLQLTVPYFRKFP